MANSEWIVENTWNCGICRKLNKGRDLSCRGCGYQKTARDVDMVGDSVVTDAELLRQARAGENWSCGFCGSLVRNLSGECGLCGGAREHGDDLPETKRGGAAVVNAIRSRRVLIAAAVLGGLAALSGLVWLVVWLATPRKLDATVSQIDWKYTENLRTRETYHAEDWGHRETRGFYNEPVFNESCRQKYYGDEKCNPHNCNPHPVSYECECASYECGCHTVCTDNRNGYSTCRQVCSTCQRCNRCERTEYDTCYDSCPVYKTWCEYDYYDWPVVDSRSTNGFTHETNWPGLQATQFQRIQRVEHYHVVFKTADETLEHEPTQLSSFKRFFVGEVWRIEVGKVTGRVEPIQRVTAEADE